MGVKYFFHCFGIEKNTEMRFEKNIVMNDARW